MYAMDGTYVYKHIFHDNISTKKKQNTQATPLDVLDLDGTAEQTSPAGSNETNLLTGDSLAVDGRGLSDMLVITTTVGMVNRVHSHTTSTGPAMNVISVNERTTIQ
jgi:hypothetical protein